MGRKWHVVKCKGQHKGAVTGGMGDQKDELNPEALMYWEVEAVNMFPAHQTGSS